VFNLNAGNQSGSVSSKIAVWNGTIGGGPNYDVIGTGSGQSRWYTMIETAGNVREIGGTVYVQDYFSPGVAQLTRTGNCWNGGSTVDSLWKTPENWSTGAAPQANDKLYFAGTARLTAENDFLSDTAFGGIVFMNSAGAFILHGNRIALSGEIENQSDNPQTLELGIAIAGGNITFDAGSMGIAMNAVVSEAEPGADLIKKGIGALTLSRTNTYSGETSVVEGNLTILGSILPSSGVHVADYAALTLAGASGSSLSPGTTIENDGLILIAATGQQCGSIVGAGIVGVPNGSGLTARSIVQSTLSIGGAAMPSQVPEPNSLVLLLAFGMAGIALFKARA
jgi:autotransporter-associated beta strand protein